MPTPEEPSQDPENHKQRMSPLRSWYRFEAWELGYRMGRYAASTFKPKPESGRHSPLDMRTILGSLSARLGAWAIPESGHKISGNSANLHRMSVPSKAGASVSEMAITQN